MNFMRVVAVLQKMRYVLEECLSKRGMLGSAQQFYTL
jgi:hypothetical protein